MPWLTFVWRISDKLTPLPAACGNDFLKRILSCNQVTCGFTDGAQVPSSHKVIVSCCCLAETTRRSLLPAHSLHLWTVKWTSGSTLAFAKLPHLLQKNEAKIWVSLDLVFAAG